MLQTIAVTTLYRKNSLWETGTTIFDIVMFVNVLASFQYPVFKRGVTFVAFHAAVLAPGFGQLSKPGYSNFMSFAKFEFNGLKKYAEMLYTATNLILSFL